MFKYVRKPVEVMAMQFTDENKDRAFGWASEVQMNIYPSFDDDNNPVLKVPMSANHEAVCKIGDYLVEERYADRRRIEVYDQKIFESNHNQLHISNEIKNADNTTGLILHAFERCKITDCASAKGSVIIHNKENELTKEDLDILDKIETEFKSDPIFRAAMCNFIDNILLESDMDTTP